MCMILYNYDVADDIIKTVLLKLIAFSTHGPTIEKIPMQKQTTGFNNCSVYAVVLCVAVLLKKNPSHIVLMKARWDPICAHALKKNVYQVFLRYNNF